MADQVMSILHMGEKQFVGGSLWSSATSAKRRLAITPSQKMAASQKSTTSPRVDSTSHGGFGTRLRGMKPRAAQAPVTKRNLDQMPSVLMQAALQAAMAWESGQQLYQQLNSEESSAPLPPEQAPSGDDVKRLIASNLETVHWSHNRSEPTSTERAGDVKDVPVVEQKRKRPGGVLPGTLIQAAGHKQSSKRSAARHRMLEMLTTWPAEGIAISLEALPFEVASIVKGKAASAAALLGMHGTAVSTVGVGTAAVTAEGVPEEDLTDALCGQLGYPYDLVVPGMLPHNMLEFSVDAETGEVRLKLMTNWRRAAGLESSGKKAEKGIYKDFMAMLLRAYDSKGRDVFSSSSSDTGSAEFSDGFGSMGGAGSKYSSVSGGGALTPGVHQRNVPYSWDGHLQPGAVSGQQRVAATTPMRHQQGRSRKNSQSRTAAGSALQQGAEDDPLLSWTAQHMGATGVDAARQNAEKFKAARGVRRSVMDTSGHSAATHRGASGGLNAVDVRDARGVPVHLDLCDAEDLLQLPPCDPDLTGEGDIHVYIVPDGAGRLLRVVDGGSARGLLQLADVTAMVEEAALAMQGARLPAEPSRAQLIFSQHLSATERALAQDAVHRYVRRLGLQTVQELMAGIRLAAPPGGEGDLGLGPLSAVALRGAWTGQRGGDHRGVTQSGGADGLHADASPVIRSVGILGGVAMMKTRLSQAKLRASAPDQWRTPGAAVDDFIPPVCLEGLSDGTNDILRDQAPGARRFHVPAVPTELGVGVRLLAQDGGAKGSTRSRAGTVAMGGSWRFSGAGPGQFSGLGPAMHSPSGSIKVGRESFVAPWRAGQAPGPIHGGDAGSGPLFRPGEPLRASKGPAWRPSGIAHDRSAMPHSVAARLSAKDIERIKQFGWNRSVEWRQAIAEAARARLARRQQLMLERSQPPQPQQAPQVDFDDVAQHMATLMQLYRSEVLDTVRGGGGERELWEEASLHLAHAAQIDPRTGETLLRVADGHATSGTHLLQALHVAAGASAWQAHDMPAVGLPLPLTPAVDFRSVEPGSAQRVPGAGTHAQPHFLVGGHETLEAMVGEPQTAGKLIVAAPDVASHVVHTRSPCPSAIQGTAMQLLQRTKLQRKTWKLGRRAWPAHQALTATSTSMAPVLDATLEGHSLGHMAVSVGCDVATELQCHDEISEGPDGGYDQRDRRDEAGVDECQGVESEEQGNGVGVDHDSVGGMMRNISQGTAGPAGIRHQKRLLPRPRMLRVGITVDLNEPQVQQLGPGQDFVQCALQAKAVDRVLLSDMDVQITSQR